MYQEITQCTHRHYASDLRQFFIWVNKPPATITVSDVDGYITHCRAQGHAIATLNRRLAALHPFYHSLPLRFFRTISFLP